MMKIKRVLWIVGLLILGLAGCGDSEQQLQSDFSALIADPLNSEQIWATSEFLHTNLDRFSEDDAGDMIAAYEDLLLRYITENPDHTLVADLKPYYDLKTGLIDAEKLQAGQLATFYENITDASMFVVYYENAMTLRVNYRGLIESYGTFLPDYQLRLYELTDEIVRKPISENATLMVDWEILLERALQAETLLKEFPEVELIQTEALWVYTSHINTILMGTTNTPIFDYKTMEFSKKAKMIYEDFLISNSETTLSWVLIEYFTYLHSVDDRLDYSDSTMSKVFFDTCDWLVSEAEKRVME
jgi:hypothetical protein